MLPTCDPDAEPRASLKTYCSGISVPESLRMGEALGVRCSAPQPVRWGPSGAKDVTSERPGPRGRIRPTTFAEHPWGRGLARDQRYRGQDGRSPGCHGLSEEPGRQTVTHQLRGRHRSRRRAARGFRGGRDPAGSHCTGQAAGPRSGGGTEGLREAGGQQAGGGLTCASPQGRALPNLSCPCAPAVRWPLSRTGTLTGGVWLQVRAWQWGCRG